MPAGAIGPIPSRHRTAPAGRRKRAAWAILLVMVLAAAAAWYFLIRPKPAAPTRSPDQGLVVANPPGRLSRLGPGAGYLTDGHAVPGRDAPA